MIITCFCFVFSSCLGGGEQRRTGPSVGSVWRCLAMSSVCLHVKISTIKWTSCRWVWRNWLSNCSRYTGGRLFSQSLTSSDCHMFIHTPVFSLNLPSFLFVLQGHEVQLNHRAVLMTEELVLPSLSGLPVKLGINMTSLLSLRLKGNVNYRDTSHFSLTGYIRPKYSTLPRITGATKCGYRRSPVECNCCLYSQCLRGANCQDGGWRCFGSGCCGLGLWAEELHQSGRQHSAAGGAGSQGHT